MLGVDLGFFLLLRLSSLLGRLLLGRSVGLPLLGASCHRANSRSGASSLSSLIVRNRADGSSSSCSSCRTLCAATFLLRRILRSSLLLCRLLLGGLTGWRR